MGFLEDMVLANPKLLLPDVFSLKSLVLGHGSCPKRMPIEFCSLVSHEECYNKWGSAAIDPAISFWLQAAVLISLGKAGALLQGISSERSCYLTAPGDYPDVLSFSFDALEDFIRQLSEVDIMSVHMEKMICLLRVNFYFGPSLDAYIQGRYSA